MPGHVLTTHRSVEIVVSCTIGAVGDAASGLFGSHVPKFVEPRRHGHPEEVLVFAPRLTEERTDAVETLNDGVGVIVAVRGQPWSGFRRCVPGHEGSR